MRAVERLDSFQQRHPVVGIPLAVFYKYLDDQGAYLAALLTYYGFIAIFPALLLFSSMLGFVLENNPELRAQLLDSAFRQIPVLGSQLQSTLNGGLGGSGIAVAIGLLGALYGAMGVAQASQHALNVAWNIPRNRRPNPFLLRAKALLLLLSLVLFVVGSTALSQVPSVLNSFGIELAQHVIWLFVAGSTLLAFGLFVLYSRIGIGAYVGHRTLLPGAIHFAVLYQVLQYFGGRLIGRFSSGAVGATYGTFGVILGLLAWIYLTGVTLVWCTELNSVLARKLYPRSLLTPMTDEVNLTDADVRAYTALVRSQQLKGFQHVTVNFDYDGQYAARPRKDDAGQAREIHGEPLEASTGAESDPGAPAAPKTAARPTPPEEPR